MHFHEFMLEVHHRMHALRISAPDYGDPVRLVAHDIASATTLLCFDEFQVRRARARFGFACLIQKHRSWFTSRFTLL